jgi:hypothetical protein
MERALLARQPSRVARPRGTGARPARRAAASSSTSGSDPGDDPPGEPPPRLTLWRHPRFGSATPNLLRRLVRAQVAEEAQR